MDSYMRMEPATEALSELMRPTIGMRTMKSQASFVRRLMPLPSLPTTSTSGPVRSAS